MSGLIMEQVSSRRLQALLGTWRGRGPAYRDLAVALRLFAADGRLPAETRLPAERDLAARLGISRTTVAAAYEQLRSEGYLHSRRGAGSTITLPAAGSVPSARGLLPRRPAEGVLDLAVAAMPAPQPLFTQAVAAATEALAPHSRGHGYDPAGLADLRAAVADRYRARGVPTSPDEVLVTCGAQHAFTLLLSVLATRGDRVLVECPTYPNTLAAIERAGARAVPVPFGDGGGWDVDLIVETIRHSGPRLAYLIPDFQNPTGRLMAEPERTAIARAAERSGTYLVADEAFADLPIDPSLTADGEALPRTMAGRGDHLVAVGSLSKSFWAGLRIGWVRAPAALVRRLTGVRAIGDVAPPVLEQLIAVRLLRDGHAALRERREALRRRRDVLVAALSEAFGQWTFTLPPGGMSLWVNLGTTYGGALTVAARERGLLLAPGSRFGPAAYLERYLRMPYTLPEEHLLDAVHRLVPALQNVGQTPPAETGPIV